MTLLNRCDRYCIIFKSDLPFDIDSSVSDGVSFLSPESNMKASILILLLVAVFGESNLWIKLLRCVSQPFFSFQHIHKLECCHLMVSLNMVLI